MAKKHTHKEERKLSKNGEEKKLRQNYKDLKTNLRVGKKRT